MKNKLILIIGIVVVIIIAAILINKSSNRGSIDSVILNGTSTAGTSSTKTIDVNGQQIPVSGLVPVTTNEKEKKANIVFSCADNKSIEGLAYVGGQNPRIEISLIDYAEVVPGVPNEMRKFMLQQVPAEFGDAKYSTRDGSITLSVVEDDETHLYENGKEVFKKCHYTTSSFVE